MENTVNREVCPIRVIAAAIAPKTAECVRMGCAWWTEKGVCAIKLLAQEK